MPNLILISQVFDEFENLKSLQHQLDSYFNGECVWDRACDCEKHGGGGRGAFQTSEILMLPQVESQTF